MKQYFFLFTIILLFDACSKDQGAVQDFYCDGLITDTAGTNDPARIYMPSAFTPNNDGLNDLIRPITINTAAIVFTIFDESGNVVFNSLQSGPGWNSSVAANSFIKYYYKIQVTTSAGHKIGECGTLYKMSCKPVNSPPLTFEDQLTSLGFTGPTSEVFQTCP
jgi:gliding motility-associated-like protein